VIGVSVGEQDGVDAAQVVGERLRAEVCRGVDQDRADRAGKRAGRRRSDLDQDRRPRAPVARIRGSADLAVATDRRNAMRGAAAEDRDAKG